MNNRGAPMGRGFDGRGRGQFPPGRGGFNGRGPQMGRGGRGMLMGRGSPDNFHGRGRGNMMGGRGFNNGPPGRGFNNGPHGRGPPMMDGRGRGPMGRGPPMNGRGNNFRDHHPNNNIPMNNRGPMNRPPPPGNRMMGPPMNGPGPMGHPNQRPLPPPPMMNGPPMGHPQHMNQMQINNHQPPMPPNNMMMGPPMGQSGGPPNMMQNGPPMMGPPMNNQGPGFPQQQMQMGPPIMQPPPFQQQQQPPMQIQQQPINPRMIPSSQQMMQPQIMQAIPPNQPQQQQPPPQSMPQQHQQPQTAPTSKGNPDSAWTEHKSPAGLSYYYNTVTRVSTYEKPAALGGGDTSSQISTKQSASVSSSTTKWQTYTDESTGKKYYSDGVTTTWSKPDDLIDDDNTSNSGSTQKQKRSHNASGDDHKTKKRKVDTSEYSNKAEALAAFKGLLLAKDIAPTTKWQDVVKTCSDDKRWDACTTMGERKQALAEYQTKRANELRDVKRQEKVRAKEAYQRLLTNVLPSSEVFTPGTSRFTDVRDLLSKDDRFYAVEDETTREELYYEFVEELRKKDERSKRNKIREAKENCLSFFKAKEEEGKLSFASTWSSFMTSLDDEEKNDVRFAISPNLIEKDRQVYFSDYVIELQNEEDEKRRRIRDARRRAEKEQRDAFHNRLSELAKDGAIAPDTRWRSMEDKLSSEPTYEPVNAQGRDVACDLFEDFVYDWKEEYRRDKVILGRVWEFSKKDFVFDTNEDTNVLDDFGKMLLESSADHQDLYGEIRRMSTRENPLYLSSIALFFKELKEDKESGKKNANGVESSEDEGEIKEDEEEVSEKED